jgi:hypothetical protein
MLPQRIASTPCEFFISTVLEQILDYKHFGPVNVERQTFENFDLPALDVDAEYIDVVGARKMLA